MHTMDGRSRDSGFGLVEVVVAVALLGFLAIAILPVLITGLALTIDQSAKATATRAVNAVVERARVTPTCANLTDLKATPPPVADGRGRALLTSITFTGCPAATTGPKFATLSVSISLTAGGQSLASADTIISLQ